jgi:DNA-binding NarL/FixJ family response regulator
MLVREIAAGNVFHSFQPTPSAAPVVPLAARNLTTRELEILRLMAAGNPNGRIAAQLWVTEQTVKFHLSNIYRKLGVANRTEASHFAHMHRLLDTSSVPAAAPITLAA